MASLAHDIKFRFGLPIGLTVGGKKKCAVVSRTGGAKQIIGDQNDPSQFVVVGCL